MDGATSDVPLILAGSVSLFVFVIAAAAVALEEEENIMLLNEAARFNLGHSSFSEATTNP